MIARTTGTMSLAVALRGGLGVDLLGRVAADQRVRAGDGVQRRRAACSTVCLRLVAVGGAAQA